MAYNAHNWNSETVVRKTAMQEIDNELARVSAESGENKTATALNDLHTQELKLLGWTTPNDCPVQNELNGTTLTVKVGRVDLGSLNFTYDGNTNAFLTENFGIKSESVQIYSKYGYKGTNSPAYDWSDKSVFCNASYVYIKNTSYTDATAFKTAMNGVYLYYELATPYTMDITGHTKSDDLADFGLNNVFDGRLEQGGINGSGEEFSSNNHCRTPFYSCKSGDTITVKAPNVSNPTLYVHFYTASGYVGNSYKTETEITVQVPSGATRFRIDFQNTVNPLWTSQVGHIGVYVNNALESIITNSLIKMSGSVTGSLDNVKKNGIYYMYGATSIPSTSDGYGLLIVFEYNAVLQICAGYGNAKIAYRVYNHTTDTWNAWQIL